MKYGDETNNPQSPGEFYGEELRRRREAAGLTQEELGERVICSGSLIAHFEAGRRKPQPDIAQRMDEVLETGGLFARMRRTLHKARFADHFAPVAELETQATAICEYAVSLVPGLLQTEAYAREIFQTAEANPRPEEIDRGVVNRLERARLLDDPSTPVYWVILNENVIRAVVGGPAVMAEQLRHISQLGRQGRVLVQVMPHSVGAHATMHSMMRLFSFSDAPEAVYVEGLHTGSLIDDPAMVRRLQDAYDLSRAAALAPRASLDLLDSVAEEYAHDQLDSP
ncbi:helix-turn-helix transcriptional regulator [Streptomyces sp. NPDC005438]|uniref:helix-turn-helix domain-containing protein n=1 Tax=Streptomyces sp. NPDC005438 TaxID=3156880 RepID=UPI0033BE3113